MKNIVLSPGVSVIKIAALIFCLLGSAVAPAVFAAEANRPVAQKSAVVAKVNINTASAEDLAELLTGVGPKKAEAIIAYREANGPFKAADDLINVKGIGEATLAKNRDRIAL